MSSFPSIARRAANAERETRNAESGPALPAAFNSTCSILHLEDSSADAALIRDTLRAAGVSCSFVQARDRKEFTAALESERFDLILADHTLPSFDGLAALELARRKCPEVPFIFLSGTMNEARTAESFRHGAVDYVPKEGLARLGPSVRRAIDDLRERQERRRAEADRDRFFNLSVDLLCVAGFDGYLKRTNPSWERCLGFTADELQATPIFDLAHAEDRDAVKRHLDKLASTGQPALFESRFRRRDGSYLWLQWNAVPLPDLRLIYASARDITDRRRVELEMQKLAAFPRLNPHAVFEFDADGALNYFNDAALEMARSLGENHPSRILPSDITALVRNCLTRGTREGEARAEPKWDQGYQGSRGASPSRLETCVGGRTLSWLFYPIMAGGVVHCYASDITERKRAEEQLREQAALLDKAQDAILVRDLEHRIIYWNKSAERIFGWSCAEATAGREHGEISSAGPPNSPATPFYPASFLPRSAEAWQAVLHKGEWSGEVRQPTKSGGEVIVESRWTLVRDAQGQPKSILVLCADITERKRLEAQFLRAQRLESIGTLASGIAHDLNNILAPILMSVNLLQETITEEREARLLETLRSGVQRGAEMVQQILSFTRGQEGARCQVNLKHLISEVSKIVQETFPKKIRVQTVVGKNLWAVLADTTQIHQVLMNLCVNARDAMPDGGTLLIQAENLLNAERGARNADPTIPHNECSASRVPHAAFPPDAPPGPYLVLTVADTGTGIPPEIIERIWEPFFTMKPQGQGTGLGLSTVLNIVKAHGGFIRTETELRKGTRFRVFLPAAESATRSAAPEPAAAIQTGHGENILVVDDERAFQEITKAIFNKYGYRVLTANDGTEAVALFAQHKDDIDLVMTDMVMPYLDGPATINALRRLDPNVRIIASSGLSENEKLAREFTNAAFLLKPFTTEKLLATVGEMLDARKQLNP